MNIINFQKRKDSSFELICSIDSGEICIAKLIYTPNREDLGNIRDLLPSLELVRLDIFLHHFPITSDPILHLSESFFSSPQRGPKICTSPFSLPYSSSSLSFFENLLLPPLSLSLSLNDAKLD